MTANKCAVCKQEPATGSAIINGKYYKQIGSSCKTQLNTSSRVNSGAARWNREMDYLDNEAAVQQPFIDGKPNPKFIAAYPSQARNHFTDEQMRNAIR